MEILPRRRHDYGFTNEMILVRISVAFRASLYEEGGEMNEGKRAVIGEFRANKGKVGGPFAGGTLLLLATTGRKSGNPFTTPLMYLADGDRFVVYASKGGAPTSPDWYHNLLANPRVSVEVGTEKFEADAKVVTGPERDDFYARQVAMRPVFAEYEQRTTRKIPVVALERVS